MLLAGSYSIHRMEELWFVYIIKVNNHTFVIDILIYDDNLIHYFCSDPTLVHTLFISR